MIKHLYKELHKTIGGTNRIIVNKMILISLKGTTSVLWIMINVWYGG